MELTSKKSPRVEVVPVRNPDPDLPITPVETLDQRETLPLLERITVTDSTNWLSEKGRILKIKTKLKRDNETKKEGQIKNFKIDKTRDKTRNNIPTYRSQAGTRKEVGVMEIGGTEVACSGTPTPSTSRETLGDGWGRDV